VKRRVEGTLFDGEEILGNSPNVHDDTVAMHRTQLGECVEDEKIERALEVVLSHELYPRQLGKKSLVVFYLAVKGKILPVSVPTVRRCEISPDDWLNAQSRQKAGGCPDANALITGFGANDRLLVSARW
jgi:hypothetical protein